jgi:hypothetical protein
MTPDSDLKRRLMVEIPKAIADMNQSSEAIQGLGVLVGPNPDLATFRSLAPTFRLHAKAIERVADLFEQIPLSQN